MSNGPELDTSQWGWIIALAASSWGVILRYVIGHYIKIADKLDKRLAAIESRLTEIERRSWYRRQED